MANCRETLDPGDESFQTGASHRFENKVAGWKPSDAKAGETQLRILRISMGVS